MKEIDILTAVRSDIQAATPDDTAVRTKGGDEPQTFPRVIIDWNTRRVSDNGANPFSHFEYDSDGNLVGAVKHHYFSFTMDLEFKSDDELQVFDLGDSVQRVFMQYEDTPDDFHPHSYLWEVGDLRPQRNPVMEPDWYETTNRIQFRFLKKIVNSDVDELKQIQYDITPK